MKKQKQRGIKKGVHPRARDFFEGPATGLLVFNLAYNLLRAKAERKQITITLKR